MKKIQFKKGPYGILYMSSVGYSLKIGIFIISWRPSLITYKNYNLVMEYGFNLIIGHRNV